MERINAVTFAPFCARGTFEKEETRQSLKLMKEKTGQIMSFLHRTVCKRPHFPRRLIIGQTGM